MGYERKKLQILGGGYNALPPVDKVPVTDYLLAQNWRTDTLGQLTSRAGYPRQFSIAGAGIAHSAASTGGVLDPYYVGANSAIVAPTGSLYYDGNPAPIATGFDGKRIAFAAQNGSMWVMNRGNQGRHDAASGWLPFGLTPPKASPTAAPAAAPSFVDSVTYTYALVGDPDYVHSVTISGVTYSRTESVYSALEICQALVTEAGLDSNCAVSNDGLTPTLLITPIVPGALTTVMGSDGNPDTVLGITGSITSLPSGTYVYYLTFESADHSLESNPSGASPVASTVVAQSIEVTIPTGPGQDGATDPRVFPGGWMNLYRAGGTLGAPYRVAQLPAVPPGAVGSTVVYLDSASDATLTANGQVMPGADAANPAHDPPPAASGMIGPHFSRLYAWSTVTNRNRLFWTPVNQPQYWPGSADPQVGYWVDVGLDGEEIVWCSIHSNLIVIYKERSIWRLIGSDPSTATLEQVYDGLGLANAFALAPAGQIDYFAGPNGLYLFDMAQVHELSGAVLPLFNQKLVNAGALTPPGGVLPGTAFNSASTAVYAISLGHALGRLYVSYAENGVLAYNMLVLDEGPEPERQAFITGAKNARWFYHRNQLADVGGFLGFFGFFFDGQRMLGLSGTDGGDAQGFDIADYRGFLTTDPGPTPIECVYQSHYEDSGAPDNDKVWLEVAIDYEYDEGAPADVYAAANNGNVAAALIGTLATGARQTVSFPFTGLVGATEDGFLARNLSILIDIQATGRVVLHNVYLYFYLEARLARVAATIPTDLGIGKVKECKELELDIDASAAAAIVVTDLPGNQLAIRHTIAVASAGRAVLKYPFAVTEGLLWKVAVAGGGSFRLYTVRLLMRVVGVYVEGYESVAGFRWDSMEIALSGGEVSTIDAARFEMEAHGASTVEVFADLPGEAFSSKGVFTLTTGATGRAWVTVPALVLIEARSVRVQVTGNTGYRIYKAQIRHRRIGLYLAGNTPSGNQDAYNPLQFDFLSERRRMLKRIEIDLWAAGTVSMTVKTDQDGGTLSTFQTFAITSPGGRRAVLVILAPGARGRLVQILLTSPQQARVYKVRLWTRTVNERIPDAAGWRWEEYPMTNSEVVPTWSDLVVEETPPVWSWVDVPFEVTG